MTKQPVEQIVFERLRLAILHRELAPGTQLVEMNISSKMNVSRTPVRNAIQKLSAQGLVDIIPNRGAFVVNPTMDEVIQAYTLRRELETMAAKLAIEAFIPADFEAMKSCIENEKVALANKDINGYLTANKEFHTNITSKCGNRFLNEFIETLLDKTDIYLILFDSYFDEGPFSAKSPEEHTLIMEALQKGNMTEVDSLLHEHFEQAIVSLSRKIKEFKNVEDLF